MADTRTIDYGKFNKVHSGRISTIRQYTGERVTVRVTCCKELTRKWTLEAYTTEGYCIAYCDSTTYRDVCKQALAQALQEWQLFGITNSQMQEFMSLYTGAHVA